MFFLFIILISLLISLIICMITQIEVKINNLVINTKNKKNINNDYEIIIQLKLLNKIPIIKINKNQLNKIRKKLKINERINKLEKEMWKNKEKVDVEIKDIIEILKKYMNIKEFNILIQIGTENAYLTAILVAILYSFFGIYFSNKNLKLNKVKYTVNPIYNEKNLIKIRFSSIFQIKLIHIINIIYVLKKKGGKKYERTSHRRSYDYSYE